MGKKQQYKFGTKNNWRARVWNRAVSRMAVPPRDAVALYLAGPDDLDRPLAVRKGFDPLNLIAVNDDQTVVDRVRANGGIAIRGDVFDVLRRWPTTTPVSFLNIDLCCGIQGPALVLGVASILMAPRAKNLVVALNFQRGRDADSNDLRGLVKAVDSKFGGFDVPNSHRGMQFYWLLALMMNGTIRLCDDRETGGVFSLELADEPFSRKRSDLIKRYCAPVFDSYKSGVWMDSVILTLPFRPHRHLPVPNTDLRKRITASLAVRTQKKNRRAERSKPTLRVIRAA